MSILSPMTWLYGAIALALVAGSGYLYGRNDGKKIERVEWQAREKKADDAAAVELKKVTDDATKKERASAAAVAVISGQFQQELKHERTKKDRIISDLRAGTVRLRDPGTRHPLSSNPVPTTGTGPGRCDAGPGTDFSREASEFLVSEASRADEITRQLTACQKIVRKDRALK